MKYIHTTTAVLLAALLLMTLTSCSPDIEEEEKEGKGVAIIKEPYSPPEPHWADGTITIKIGRYETEEEMVDILDYRENFHAFSAGLRKTISREDFPMSKVPKTVKITVFILSETGVTEEITREEVRRRFKEMGYRPLTLEEAIMLRIDFTDQPDIRESDHKMTHFNILLSEEDEYFIWPSKSATLMIKRDSGRDKYGEGYVIAYSIDLGSVRNLFSPTDRFACVKVN